MCACCQTEFFYGHFAETVHFMEAIMQTESNEAWDALLRTAPIGDDLFMILTEHTNYFDQEKITCEKLLNVMFFPFLKLAQQINNLAGSPASSSRRVLKDLYENWIMSIFVNLGCAGVARMPGTISDGSLAELMAALINARFPEVRTFYVSNFRSFLESSLYNSTEGWVLNAMRV